MTDHSPLDLRVIGLFEELNDADLEFVSRRCVLQAHSAHEQILGEQDETSDVFFILKGQVRINSYSGSGREIIFSDVGVGGMFGEFSAVDRQPRSATVVARTECLLARMTSDDFFVVIRSYGSVAVRLIEVLTAKIRSMSERTFEVSTLAVRVRVVRELVRLAASGRDEGESSVLIEPAPTHYEIAARIGSHREAVTREFNRLEAAGVIAVRRGHIRIVSKSKLETLAER